MLSRECKEEIVVIVRAATGCSEAWARAELDAEEWDLEAAIWRWKVLGGRENALSEAAEMESH